MMKRKHSRRSQQRCVSYSEVAILAAQEHALKRSSSIKHVKSAMTINERWERGVSHDLRSIALYKSISKIDYEECDDFFGFTRDRGRDDYNDEMLMYMFDMHFENEDKQSKINRENIVLIVCTFVLAFIGTNSIVFGIERNLAPFFYLGLVSIIMTIIGIIGKFYTNQERSEILRISKILRMRELNKETEK